MNPEDVIARLSGPMSLPRRIATTVAALGGLTGAGLVGVLWLTERALPPRTQVAFGALVLIGLAWAGYGSWALTRRTPLFARDRVIAGWLAVAAATAFAVTATAITIARCQAEPTAYVAAAVLLILAVVNLAWARAHRAALLRRRHDLGG